MKKLGNHIQQVWAVDYSVKTARFLVRMWGMVLILAVTTMAITLIFPDEKPWGSIAVQACVLVIDTLMLKYALEKLARAKNAAWVRSMYEEWSRLS